MIALVLILIYFFILVIEFYPLLKEKCGLVKMLVYAVLTLISLTIDILLSLGIRVPSPADPIKKVVLALIGK